MPNPKIPEQLNNLESKVDSWISIIKEIQLAKVRETEQQKILPEIKMNKVFLEGINGLFQTTSRIPTHTPRNFNEQIVLVDSGGTIMKLYTYFGNAWKFQRFYNT